MVAAKHHTDLALLGRLLRQARPYRRHIVGMFLLSLLSTPLALLTPLPLKIAVDSAIGQEPIPAFLNSLLPAAATQSVTGVLILATTLLITITLLSQLQTLGSSLLSTYTGEKLLLDFRSHLFGHVQRLSLSYHDSKGTSDSIYRIQYDTGAIQYVATEGIIPFVTAAFTLVSMLYVTIRLDWQLALVALIVSPILFVIARLYRRNLREQSRRVKRLESAALSVVQEVLSSVRVVKAFGQEDREQRRFMRHSNEGLWARFRLSFAQAGLGLLLSLTTAIGTAAVLFVGVRHIRSGTLTLGDLLLVMGYLSQLYGPLKIISKKIASLQSHLASAERAFALLDEAPDVMERPNARPLARAEGAILMHDVSFAYNNDSLILRDVHCHIPAGMRVGIVGRTGAGKTTLVSLLTRFYDPTAGSIQLDGIDLRDYKLSDLRNQFSIVLQDTVLFSTSIAENIAYARPGASKKDIIDAARAANAHDFIMTLPHRYLTQVGERGMRLSGGERQRIALARAFLKNAPVLIFDEPTSSVDVRTERGIMEAMERLMQGRTTFMIAHRMGTLEKCHLMLILEDGCVTVKSDVSTVVKDALTLGEVV